MNSFRDMVEADNKNVFLNTNEFAENHIIIYNDTTYSGIPVLLTKVKEKERVIPASDNAQGLYLVAATLHMSLSDMNGTIPEKDQYIMIDNGTALGAVYFSRYKIASSDCTAGMICLELEAIDE